MKRLRIVDSRFISIHHVLETTILSLLMRPAPCLLNTKGYLLFFLSLVLSASALYSQSNAILPVSLYGHRFTPSLVTLPDINPAVVITDSRFLNDLSRLEEALNPETQRLMQNADSVLFNDWLRFKLLVTYSTRLCEASQPSISPVIVAVAALRSVGYKATVGQTVTGKVRQIIPLIAIDETLFFASSISVGSHSYFIFDHERARLRYVESGQLEFVPIPDSKTRKMRGMRLDAPFTPRFPDERVQRTIRWKSKLGTVDTTLSIPVVYNANYIRYLEALPQRDLPTYFNEPQGPFLGLLAEEFSRLHARLSVDSVAFLQVMHDFLLNGFPYKEDRERQRGEHCNFAEESLADDYTDCEDRSILLAHLIRAVLGWEVIVLEYPDHVSLGVKLPPTSRRKGATFIFDGKQYDSCDPSFFNGKIGDISPQYKSKTPKRVFPVSVPSSIASY